MTSKLLMTLLSISMMGGFARAASEETTDPNVSAIHETTGAISDNAADSADDEDTEEAANDTGEQMKMKVKEVCKKVNLTEEQRGKVKDAIKAAREQKLVHRANLKALRVLFAKIAVDPTKKASDVDPLITKAAENVSALVMIRGNLKKTIFFDILTPEQRKPALACVFGIKRLLRLKLISELRD